MEKRFVIVHYNTPLLTDCLVRSINLFVENAIIYIFDNSDKDPFIANFDNVIIFDNTNGQIIDFNKWLEKYPNRFRSNGKSNKWGSAKHCYSVEKCMELIGENFILLDSDVLLKKDCSDLFDDKYIYCGEVITQPKSTVKRVLPFICFINVQLCKKYCVHYFDENHMHGLCYNIKNKYADRYDTGGGFYINSSKLNHKEIDISKYIVHYGSGSWVKKGLIYAKSPKEWINYYKKYWSNKMNKKVVYTCITGGYDDLIEPTYVTSDFDYVCFTDNMELKSDVWDIKPLPKETEGLNQVKKQRFVKINPHKMLGQYDLSIWVDGNVEITGDLNEFLDETIKDDFSIYIPRHPSRDCIYDELEVVLAMRKDTVENAKPQIDRYTEEGFPKNYGLVQSNILLRKHNELDCIKLMNMWFEEVKNGSHRDQLSFNYALWKNQDIDIVYLNKNIYNSKWFKWKFIHNRGKKNSKQSSEKKVTKMKPIIHAELFEEANNTAHNNYSARTIENNSLVLSNPNIVKHKKKRVVSDDKKENQRKRIRLTDANFFYSTNIPLYGEDLIKEKPKVHTKKQVVKIEKPIPLSEAIYLEILNPKTAKVQNNNHMETNIISKNKTNQEPLVEYIENDMNPLVKQDENEEKVYVIVYQQEQDEKSPLDTENTIESLSKIDFLNAKPYRAKTPIVTSKYAEKKIKEDKNSNAQVLDFDCHMSDYNNTNTQQKKSTPIQHEYHQEKPKISSACELENEWMYSYASIKQKVKETKSIQQKKKKVKNTENYDFDRE